MSILDGLALYDADGHEVPRSHKELGCYFLSGKVERALTNPSDEQVEAIVRATCPPWAQSELERDLVRAVLAAAAGVDQ